MSATQAIIRAHAESQAGKAARPRARVYGLPPKLVKLLQDAQAGKFEVMVAMDRSIISDDPDAVAAVEEVLCSTGVSVVYASDPQGPHLIPSRPDGKQPRASLYARDLHTSKGVERLPALETDQDQLRELLSWLEGRTGAAIGSARAVALLPLPGDPKRKIGYLLVRE